MTNDSGDVGGGLGRGTNREAMRCTATTGLNKEDTQKSAKSDQLPPARTSLSVVMSFRLVERERKTVSSTCWSPASGLENAYLHFRLWSTGQWQIVYEHSSQWS